MKVNYFSFLGLLCLFICFNQAIYAQSVIEDFAKVNQRYKAAQYMKIDIEYALYDNAKVEETSEVYQGLFIGNAQYYYVKYLDTETVKSNNGYTIVVDHEEDLIAFSYNGEDEQSEFSGQPDLKAIKRYLDLADNVERKEIKGYISYNMIYVSNNSIPIKEIFVQIDKGTFLINKIKITYKREHAKEMNFSIHEPVIEITYREYSFFDESEMDDSLISYSRFFNSFSRSAYQLKEEYLHYRVIKL